MSVLQRWCYSITKPQYKLKASACKSVAANTEYKSSHQQLDVQGVQCSLLEAQQCLKQLCEALALFPQQIESAHKNGIQMLKGSMLWSV